MIRIDTPRTVSYAPVKLFHILSDLPDEEGNAGHVELREFCGRIGLACDQYIHQRGKWNEHVKAPEFKYDEALAAGAVHATGDDIIRLFTAKRPDPQGSKGKGVKAKAVRA